MKEPEIPDLDLPWVQEENDDSDDDIPAKKKKRPGDSAIDVDPEEQTSSSRKQVTIKVIKNSRRRKRDKQKAEKQSSSCLPESRERPKTKDEEMDEPDFPSACGPASSNDGAVLPISLEDNDAPTEYDDDDDDAKTT